MSKPKADSLGETSKTMLLNFEDCTPDYVKELAIKSLYENESPIIVTGESINEILNSIK